MRTPFVPVAALLCLVSGCIQVPGDDAEPTLTDPSARPQTGGSPDVPTWTVNDRWVLRTYHEASPEETREVVDEFVQAIDVLQAEGADMDAFRVVSQQTNRTTWYRMSDLALMKEQSTDADGSHETVYERPCAFYFWPLEVNNTWPQECVRTVDGTTSTLNFTATVEAEQMVGVPTGNFSTFRVRFVGSDGTTPFERTEYFAPNACFPARIVTPGSAGTVIRDLIAYECSSMRNG